MKNLKLIKCKQQLWAKRKGLDFDDKGYVRCYDKNLFGELDDVVKCSFKKAGGQELTDNTRSEAKMKALHSSSALVLNVFNYFRTRLHKSENISSITKACKVNSDKIIEITFEAKFPILHIAVPNIDMIFEMESGMIYAFESKFCEPYSGCKSYLMKDAYLKEENKSIWNGFENIYKAVREAELNGYRYLNYPQLITHLLGLKCKIHSLKKFKLIYIWYDGFGKEANRHREEIRNFTELVKKDNVQFVDITYQEIIVNLSNDNYEENKEYIDYITSRYL